MFYSGLPCFKEFSLTKLDDRFKKDMNNFEASIYMKKLIEDAAGKWTTKVYDMI